MIVSWTAGPADVGMLLLLLLLQLLGRFVRHTVSVVNMSTGAAAMRSGSKNSKQMKRLLT